MNLLKVQSQVLGQGCLPGRGWQGHVEVLGLALNHQMLHLDLRL